MHKVAIVVCSLFLFVSAASSQVPSGNVFFGYSYYNADLSSLGRSSLNGWNGSVEGKVLPWVGIVADIGGHYGSEGVPIACTGPGPCPHVSVSVHEYNFLFGPRVSVSVGKIRPFAEALFGGGHIISSPGGLRETMFRRASSARPRTMCGCRLELCCDFEESVRLAQFAFQNRIRPNGWILLLWPRRRR